MRRIVLVDGENLVYALRTLLGSDEAKAERSVLKKYSYRELIDELLEDQKPSQILWFGARLRLYDENEEIRVKSESAVRQQSSFVNDIQTQGIQFVKVGYLRARQLDPCKQCQQVSWKLTEKGVDVGLAVRMVTDAMIPDTEIVVISADTDLLPAFKAAAKIGCKIIHVGYEYLPIASLSRAAQATRIITKPLAAKHVFMASKK